MDARTLAEVVPLAVLAIGLLVQAVKLVRLQNARSRVRDQLKANDDSRRLIARKLSEASTDPTKRKDAIDSFTQSVRKMDAESGGRASRVIERALDDHGDDTKVRFVGRLVREARESPAGRS
jgi:hypothetical protein